MSEFMIAGPVAEETKQWLHSARSSVTMRDRLPEPWWNLAHQLLKSLGVLVTEAYLVHPECEVRGQEWGFYTVPGTADQSDASVWGPDKAYILGQILHEPGVEDVSKFRRLIGGLVDSYRPPVYSARAIFQPLTRPDGRCWTLGSRERLPAHLPAGVVRIPLIRLITLEEGLKGRFPLVTREHLQAAAQATPESVLASFLLEYEQLRNNAVIAAEELASEDGQRLVRFSYSHDGDVHHEKREPRRIPGGMPTWRFVADVSINTFRGLRKRAGNWDQSAHLRPSLWDLLERGAVSADEDWEAKLQGFIADSTPATSYAEEVVFGVLRLATDMRQSLVRPCSRPECRRLFWLRDRKVKTCELHRGTHRSYSNAEERRRHRAAEAIEIGVTEQRRKGARERKIARAKGKDGSAAGSLPAEIHP